VNIFHLKAAEGATLDQAKLQQAVDGVWDAYSQHFIPKLSTACILNSVEGVQFLDQSSVLEAAKTAPAGGGDSGYTLPASVALVISWKIAAYYRGGHPRTYLPGLVSDRTHNNTTWSPATLAEFSDVAQAFQDTMHNVAFQSWGSGSVFCSIQQFEKGGSTQDPKVYLDPPRVHYISGHAVHSRIDSQRRRLGKEIS